MTLPALEVGLKDEDDQARFTAALSIQRLGSDAEGGRARSARLIARREPLCSRQFGVDALRRIGTA